MEVSLVRIGDFFIKLLKNILDKMFIGSVIDQGTFSSIEGTIRQIVESLTKSNVLMGYSNLSIARDSVNPTKINISLRITPVYPLNYIDIKFSIGL
jgi:phage tail sheath protein FI